MLNPDKPFAVENHASLHAVGAVLLQSEVEEEYPKLFYSQELDNAQRNYSTYEHEMLAVVKACEAFRIKRLGSEFTLRTDHAGLLQYSIPH